MDADDDVTTPSAPSAPSALPERIPGAALAAEFAEWSAVDLWLLLRRFAPEAETVLDNLGQIAAGPATMEYAGS